MGWLWEWDRTIFRLIHEGWRGPELSALLTFASMSGVGHAHAFPLVVASVRNRSPWMIGGLILLFAVATYFIGAADGAGPVQLAAYSLFAVLFFRLEQRIARQALVAFLFSGAVHLLMKQFMDRQRPSNFIWAIPLENVYATQSFPSGHTSTSMAVAVVLFLMLPTRSWGMVALGWGLLVGLSRVYVGVHFPTDVIAGFAIGIASAASARLMGERWGSNPAEERKMEV